jgi:hypothetical protein
MFTCIQSKCKENITLLCANNTIIRDIGN